jgi:hypothetical protein
MTGLPLPSFTDWMRTVPVMFAGGRNDFINNAVKQTYRTLALAFFGRSEDDLINWDAGSDLRVPRITRTGNLYSVVNPNAQIQAPNPQVVSNAIFQMRFGHQALGWTMQEEERSIPRGVGDPGGRLSLYKKFARKLEMILHTDAMNALLEKSWASPHGASTYTAMESANASDPQHMSLPALVTEDDTNYHAGSWTNIAQIDPASDDKWRNAAPVRYNNLDPADNAGNGGGLVDALIEAVLRVSFETPPSHAEYLDSPKMRRQAILTSTAGYRLAQQVFRDSNDNWANASDPLIRAPMVGGLPIYREAQLDEAALYYTGSAYVTENSASLTNTDGNAWSTSNWCRGPRYWLINFNDILPAMHKEFFFEKLNDKRVVVPDDQPYSRRQDIAFWWNWVAQRRDTSTVVGPGSAV